MRSCVGAGLECFGDGSARGAFDVALLIGIIYHRKHPMLALEMIAPMTADLLLVGSYLDLMDLGSTQGARSTRIPRTDSTQCVCMGGDDSTRWIQQSKAHEHAEELPAPCHRTSRS